MGGDVVLIFFLTWMSRHQLVDAFRKVFMKSKTVDDSTEPMSYRFAVIGVWAGILCIFLSVVLV